MFADRNVDASASTTMQRGYGFDHQTVFQTVMGAAVHRRTSLGVSGNVNRSAMNAMRTLRKLIGLAAVLGVSAVFAVIDPSVGSAQASEQWRPIGITLDRCFPPMPFEAYERGAGSADAVIQGASFTRPPSDSGLGCPIE